jgi:predicted nucleotide-binding protein
MDSHSLINSLLDDVSKLPHRDSDRLEAVKKRARMIIIKVFNNSSPYLGELEAIHFYPSVSWSGMEDYYYDQTWNSGKIQLTSLFQTMLEDLQISHAPVSKTASVRNSPKVFVVHGHDNEMKQAVARVLEKMALEPIILHEQPDQGRTVIEKFEDYSNVGFAVVLLSPDDMAHSSKVSVAAARPRARQNVILELGFFLGKLGRERVVVFHKPVPNFEMPSDYAGVLFKPFDDAGTWQYELIKELKASGYKIDANKLV